MPGLLCLQPLLHSLSLLWVSRASGREAPNLPRWRSAGRAPRRPRPTSSGLRPGTPDLPLPSLRFTEPNESRTSLQTGPDTGANWTEPGALPVLAAGRAPGWHCPCRAGHPEPPRPSRGRGPSPAHCALCFAHVCVTGARSLNGTISFSTASLGVASPVLPRARRGLRQGCGPSDAKPASLRLPWESQVGQW